MFFCRLISVGSVLWSRLTESLPAIKDYLQKFDICMMATKELQLVEALSSSQNGNKLTSIFYY